MNIAVAADGKSLGSTVSGEFLSCRYLLIVDMDNMKTNAIINPGDPNGETLARQIVSAHCEAVITGKLTSTAFDIIADDDITRYDGSGYSVKKALTLMERNALKLIKNVEGIDECETRHVGGTCDGHHDE